MPAARLDADEVDPGNRVARVAARVVVAAEHGADRAVELPQDLCRRAGANKPRGGCRGDFVSPKLA